MDIKLDKNESLYGIKIFDGVDKETGKPYCQPADVDSKKIYETGGIVNYCGCKQYIIPIPRHTTIKFEQCDKVGKAIKNVKE